MTTKKELGQLTSLTISRGQFAGDTARERRFWCPVHMEAKRGRDVRDHEIRTHMFSAFQPYDRRSDMAVLKPVVQAALAQHLADMIEDGTPCDDVTVAVHG